MRRSKIKLLKFVTVFAIGGTERQVLDLALALDRSRFDLHLACLRRSGQFLREVEEEGIPLNEYKINCLYNHRTIARQLSFARHLRQSGIAIVHTYGFYTNVFAIPAARLASVPVVVASIRDLGDLLTPLQRRAQKWICRLADRIVANAEAVRERLVAEGYDRDKIVVIRNGIARSRFAGVAGGKLRNEYRLPPDAPLVAVLSRLNPLKGVEHFLEAAAIVSCRFDGARFLVIGDGAYRVELERHASRLGLDRRVIFTGFRLDVPQLLPEITVSVLPSLSEATSNALLESMAAGVPVVATRVGGNPEVVEDRVTGLLVAPRDPAALARAICRLLENRALAAKLGAAGKRRVAEHFSLERAVRETERLYLDLLERASYGRADGRWEARK